METILLLSLAATVAWLFWRYGYNSKKLRRIRAWKAHYKALTAKVSIFTAVEPSLRNQDHSLTDMHAEIAEIYDMLYMDTQWIRERKNFPWVNKLLNNVFEDAYRVNTMWNEYLAKWRAFYSDQVNA